MAVTKILLLATGTAAFGLMFGSGNPVMKPGPEPYWTGMAPYDASEQGESYSVTEAMPVDLNPGVPVHLASYYETANTQYAEPMPLYVPVEPVNPSEGAELQFDREFAERTTIEAEQAAESAAQAADEVQAHLASEPDAV